MLSRHQRARADRWRNRGQLEPAKPSPIGNEQFEVWAELDGGNALTRRRTSGPGFDEHIARQSAAGAVEWYAADHLGSVRLILDNSGSVTSTVVYDAFGQVLSGTVSDFGYAGYRRDGITSLDSVRAREYDPGTGMWYSEDPLGLRPDTNPFRYVGNSVTNATDPSGMQPPAATPTNILVPADQADYWTRSLSAEGKQIAAVEYLPGSLYVRLVIPETARNREDHNRIASALGLPNLADARYYPRNPLAEAMSALYLGSVPFTGTLPLEAKNDLILTHILGRTFLFEPPSPIPIGSATYIPEYKGDTIRPINPYYVDPYHTGVDRVLQTQLVDPVRYSGGLAVDAARLTYNPLLDPKYSHYAKVGPGGLTVEQADSLCISDGLTTAMLYPPARLGGRVFIGGIRGSRAAPLVTGLPTPNQAAVDALNPKLAGQHNLSVTEAFGKPPAPALLAENWPQSTTALREWNRVIAGRLERTENFGMHHVIGGMGSPIYPTAYSVIYEVEMTAQQAALRSRPRHFQIGNEALLRAVDADAGFRQSMEQLMPGFETVIRGANVPATRLSPATYVTWHHVPSTNRLQLVWRYQHELGNPFAPLESPWRELFHPNGIGGFATGVGR